MAKNGTIGLESAFGALLNVLPLEIIVQKLTLGKSRFLIDNQIINNNKIANLTLFNPDVNWVFTKEAILSKAKNSAFLEMEMKGIVYGVYNQSKLVLQ